MPNRATTNIQTPWTVTQFVSKRRHSYEGSLKFRIVPVRYTLPEGNTQIFASRYKLYFPTEEELAAELQRERHALELTRRLSQDE